MTPTITIPRSLFDALMREHEEEVYGGDSEGDNFYFRKLREEADEEAERYTRLKIAGLI